MVEGDGETSMKRGWADVKPIDTDWTGLDWAGLNWTEPEKQDGRQSEERRMVGRRAGLRDVNSKQQSQTTGKQRPCSMGTLYGRFFVRGGVRE